MLNQDASADRLTRVASQQQQITDRHALILKAVALAGSQAKLARAVGVTRSAVYYWIRHGTEMGPKSARCIEQKFGIPKEDLLPDVFGRLENGGRREVD